MASDKRDFKNFEEIPGEIDHDKNLYTFPTLYKSTDSNKVRQWSAFVRCIKKSTKTETTKKQNWSLFDEIEVPIKEEYIKDGEVLPEGISVQYWTETGIQGMKISRSAATYTFEKNVGKKNERNKLQQALVECRSKYLKKIDEGYNTNINNINDTTIDQNTKYYPMLSKKYEDFVNKIVYPIYVQAKLDGCRCIAFLNSINKPTYKNVVLYSRQQKEYTYNTSNDNIRKMLLNTLIEKYDHKNKESIFLDGELYLHNVPLQDINSIIRGQSKNDANIEYHIYDMFYPSYKTETFLQRNEILTELNKNMKDNEKKFIKLVETVYINNSKECDEVYKNHLENDYEGIMIRYGDCVYLMSATKKSELLRSKQLLKRKETYDDEFEVVGYKDGDKGKDVGAVVWICAVNNSITFNAVPNLSFEERYKLYEDCKKNFEEKYANRLIKVEYRGLSKNGVPLRAKAIAFRDIV